MLGDQRTIGRRTILSQIRKVGPVSRIELSERTGISRATVTTVTAELLEHGLIEEIPVETQNKDLKRGRPKVDLKIRGQAFMLAGMKLANQSLSIMICDFEGNVLSEYFADLQKSKFDEAELLSLIDIELDKAAQSAGITADDISALGLGLAGVVDVFEGVVRWSPSLLQRNIELGKSLSKKLNKTVFIDNDANLVAKAEQYFGMGRNVKDFLVVTVENGVGLGIILDGQLYRGTRGCGAEFGHTKVQLDGALCRCGQRGCLEAYVANYALLREWSVGQQADGAHRAPDDIAGLIEAAKSGDRMANSVLDRAARMFAMGLSNLVNVFDPELIVLSGERMQFDFLFANEVLESIRDIVVQIDAPPPEIVVHKWGDMMWARGAAAYAIEGFEEKILSEFAHHA